MFHVSSLLHNTFIKSPELGEPNNNKIKTSPKESSDKKTKVRNNLQWETSEKMEKKQDRLFPKKMIEKKRQFISSWYGIDIGSLLEFNQRNRLFLSEKLRWSCLWVDRTMLFNIFYLFHPEINRLNWLKMYILLRPFPSIYKSNLETGNTFDFTGIIRDLKTQKFDLHDSKSVKNSN